MVLPKGRSITDNILLAQEMFQKLESKVRDYNVALRIGIAKADKKVFWLLIMKVLRKFGFSEHFIDAVWRLISNCWFSVIINGQAQGYFRSYRGILYCGY